MPKKKWKPRDYDKFPLKGSSHPPDIDDGIIPADYSPPGDTIDPKGIDAVSYDDPSLFEHIDNMTPDALKSLTDDEAIELMEARLKRMKEARGITDDIDIPLLAKHADLTFQALCNQSEQINDLQKQINELKSNMIRLTETIIKYVQS